MQFRANTPLYSYEVQKEGGEDILYINYLGAPFVASVSDSPEVMTRVIDVLIENPNISRVVLVQQKNYNYDFNETSILLEIAQLYVYFLKQERILSQEKLITNCEQFFPQRYNEILQFLYLLKQDPISAYAELKKLIIEARIDFDKVDVSCRMDQKNYIGFLEKLFVLFQDTKLIKKAQHYLESYQKGDREIYHKIFKPDTLPNFTFTRLVSDLPDDAEVVDQYKIKGEDYDTSLVTILRKKGESKLLYHLSPPENSLSEDHNVLLNLAKGVLIEHQPKAEEFVDTDRTRQVFFNISKDLLQDLGESKGIKLTYSELNGLAIILVRHTIGFGLVEVLLQDDKLQDIFSKRSYPSN